MKLRLSLLVLFLAAIAVVLVRSFPVRDWMGAARNAGTPEDAPPTDAFTTLPRDSALKFEFLRDRVLAPYRLRPDRRLLLAVSEIRRLSGLPDSAVTAQFASGRWRLLCGSQEVGKLSELPDFPEMLDVLTEWARKQAWTKGWSESSGPERQDLTRALDRLDAPAALREADRAWAAGERDAALFRHAARAYAMLALETPDHGGTPDPITARSFAHLAFARALGADDPKREACLLAEVMGYSAAASELARQLPARDPLRLYVSWEDSGLERASLAVLAPTPAPVAPVAKTKAVKTTTRRGGKTTKTAARKPAAPKAPSSPGPESVAQSIRLEAPFFHLLRLANRGEYEAWFELLTRLEEARAPSALLLGTGLRLQRPEPSRLVAERLIQAMRVKRPAPRKSPAPPAIGSNLGQQIQIVEATLEQRPRPAGGVLFSGEMAKAQERILLYSALDRIAQHSLESLGPAEMARWFAQGSRKSRAGTRAALFQQWYGHLARANGGRPDVVALRADVDSAAPGPAQALRSYEALRLHLSDEMALRDAARDLAKRLDSRPEHQAQLATIAERDLLALSLAERLGTSAAALQGASETSQETETGPAPPDSIVGATYAKKLAAHPTVWKLAERYATWLEERRRYEDARRVVESWMARSPADTGWTASAIESRTQLARLHQMEGRPEQGLRVLGDLHRSGSFAAIERTALILQDMGQTHRALAIAWAAHRGQPRLAAGRALLAEIFWRQGRYAEAAKVLQDGRSELSSLAWEREIAPRFVAFFRTRASEGIQAAEALMRAGFHDRATIGAIPEALGAARLYGFAFELQSRFRLTGVPQVESALLAYGHLRRAKDEAVALRWIQDRVPAKDRELLAILAYQEGHPELLWSMPPARMEGEHGDYQWLLRAATCMTAGSQHRRYAETVNHLDRARGTYHLEVARYLLGLEEESEVLSLVSSARQRSEVCYFIGLKNEQQGRARDAADWYLMSVESGGGNNIESRWALQRLKRWASEGRPPDRTAPAQAPPA